MTIPEQRPSSIGPRTDARVDAARRFVRIWEAGTRTHARDTKLLDGSRPPLLGRGDAHTGVEL
jgi:hypothetical protein